MRDKIALVTGATGTIGWSVCTELAEAGFSLALHAMRSGPQADELAGRVRERGRHAQVIKANLAVAKECEAVVRLAYDQWSRVDVFVHCASAFERMPLAEVDFKEFDALMAVNLRAAFFLSRSIGLRMKSDMRDGRIIHFADVTRDRPYRGYLPYCMSKAAVETMVRGLALELAPEVKVNAIAPYMCRSESRLSDEDRERTSRLPLKRATEPAEIGRLVRYLAEESGTVTGQTITVDGGRSLMW